MRWAFTFLSCIFLLKSIAQESKQNRLEIGLGTHTQNYYKGLINSYLNPRIYLGFWINERTVVSASVSNYSYFHTMKDTVWRKGEIVQKTTLNINLNIERKKQLKNKFSVQYGGGLTFEDGFQMVNGGLYGGFETILHFNNSRELGVNGSLSLYYPLSKHILLQLGTSQHLNFLYVTSEYASSDYYRDWFFSNYFLQLILRP